MAKARAKDNDAAGIGHTTTSGLGHYQTARQ